MPVGPPRVVHIVQHLKAGGAEVLVCALAKGLREAGVDARFISVYSDKLDQTERAELGVPIVTIGRRSRTDLMFFPRLRRALREERADIVHAHVIAGKYAGRMAAVLEHVPSIVFTEHGDEPLGPIAGVVERFLDARTQRFVTFSSGHRTRLARQAKLALEKVVVIPNGIAEPAQGDRVALRRDLGIDPTTFALYLPARLVARKNQALPMRALAALGERYRHWQLLLAGTGEMEDELRETARRLGLAERVRFLGFRPDSPRLCRAMDAYLLPSLYERMPLALGEAMRAGVVPVTTPWVGIEDFVRDGNTGFVSEDFSDEAFARVLERLADDGVRGAVAARAKTFADRQFDLGACVRSHVELYEGLVADAKDGRKR